MADYIDNNIIFTDIDQTYLNAGQKVSGGEYKYDAEGNIISPRPIINAIDIDWNNAQGPGIDTPIKSTSDLIKTIGETREDLSKISGGDGNSIPIYDAETENDLRNNGKLPNKYISLGDTYNDPSNTSLITNLLNIVSQLQTEVNKLKNTFTRGIYSYNDEATFISTNVNKYDDIEEPIWALDEGELNEIDGVNVSSDYSYTDTNNALKNNEDCRQYIYITANSLDIDIILKSLDNIESISLNLNNLYSYSQKVNVLLILSRKITDRQYPVNFCYISITDYISNTNLINGYLNNNALVQNEYPLNNKYYIYSVDASRANAEKLNIYSQNKEVGNYIQAEVPGEDEDSYRVAHIAIRSCKNYEVIEKIKDQLVKNELIFDESKNNLYIKVNDKLINIGSQSSSGGPSGPGEEPGDDTTNMTQKEIINSLVEQGIISVNLINSELTDIEEKYDPSNIITYSFNNIGSFTFINEDTGNKYEFKTDAYGELKGTLIKEETTFENKLKESGKLLNDDWVSSRGFIGNYNDLISNISDSAADRKLKADRIRIGAIYAPLTSDLIHGCSHAYIELENTSDIDYNLEGCNLHIIRFDKSLNYYIKHTLKLKGILKGGSTYLIRGKKYIINDNDPNCFIHVDTYDQEWYVNNELIDLSIENDSTKSTVFVLTYANLREDHHLYLLNNDIDYSIESQRNYLGDATSENIGTLLICNTSIKPSYDAKATYVLPAGLIDATIIGAARYGLSLNKGWPFKLTSNCIYKNTFELDPAKQAFNGFSTKDSSRMRWASLVNDAQYLTLNKEYIEFPKSNSIKYVSDYTPKASFENKNVCTDKTKFDKEKPNAVSVSFGENIYTTRCFNWLSGSNNDEYIWIYDGDTLVGTFESYKYTANDIEQKTNNSVCNRKEYPKDVNNIVYCDYRLHDTIDRSRKDANDEYLDVSYKKYSTAKRACGLFAATNDFYISHKCVIEFNPISGGKKEFTYIVGQKNKNGLPLEGHCSERRKFTIYSNEYVPRIYQITDQQGFHWIEYQVWEAAAIKLNDEIKKDLENNDKLLPIIINTGDATQSGSRINEWLDYFNAGDVLFNHLEQNNIVGNNDLNGTDIQFLGTGDDDGKSNGYYYYLFNCVDVNNFFTDESGDHYPIINNVYVPSLYYLDSDNLRIVLANSELTEVNCRDWFNLIYNTYTVNIYTGYTLNSTIGDEEYAANKTINDGASYNAFTPIYTLLWHTFNDGNKKCIVACHEMPFTVMTFKCIAENETQLGRYRSESDASPAALIGSHMNQISKNEKGTGIYWFSRLLESSGVKLCFGGHKHTYAITYPVRENYKYTIEYNKATGSYDTVDKSSLLDGPMSMGPTLENEKGNINWIWKPNNEYINSESVVNGNWRLSEYPWFSSVNLYDKNINWSKLPITYRGKDFIVYNEDELKNIMYPAIPKYNFDTNDENYNEHDKYDIYASKAVRYIMCQATGYKLKSNKELPAPQQKFSNIIPKTLTGTSSDTPSNNQLYPMFMKYDFVLNDTELICKTYLGRIKNIFDSSYKFNQAKYDKSLGIDKMSIEYLIDKHQYVEGDDITYILEYTGGPTADEQEALVNVYDNYGLWSKNPKQLIEDIVL